MSTETRTRVRWQVMAALAVVVFLGGLLGLRLLAGARDKHPASGGSPVPAPPAATVPAPRSAEVASLSFPCWSCPESATWPIQFRTDLDLLAPLGNGTANAGTFFKDFAKPKGSRFAESEAAMGRRIDGPPWLGKVLPAGDPLLLEAEPWSDQATMRFYPDFFVLEGWETQIPNLAISLTFARSWVARGLSASDPAKSMNDFRRAIRLGRLLRQEGTTLIADLVGLSCIRLGAQGIYETATKRGDGSLALTASIVLSECAPQKLLSSAKVTKVDLTPFLEVDPSGEPVLSASDARVATVLETASKEAELRFRGEAILTLGLVRFMGNPAQQKQALAKLEELAAATGPDSRVSSLAKWSRDHKPDKKQILEILKPLPM